MVTLLIFGIFLFVIKVIEIGLRLSWGLLMLLLSVFLIPIVLIALILKGLITLAFPILIIALIISFFSDSKMQS